MWLLLRSGSPMIGRLPVLQTVGRLTCCLIRQPVMSLALILAIPVLICCLIWNRCTFNDERPPRSPVRVFLLRYLRPPPRLLLLRLPLLRLLLPLLRLLLPLLLRLLLLRLHMVSPPFCRCSTWNISRSTVIFRP